VPKDLLGLHNLLAAACLCAASANRFGAGTLSDACIYDTTGFPVSPGTGWD